MPRISCLWTNPSPAVAFAPGKINIPGLSGYQHVRIVARISTGSPQQVEQTLDYEDGATADLKYLFNMTLSNSLYGHALRRFTLAPDGITVGNVPSKYTNENSAYNRDKWLVPYKIYGIHTL